MRFLAMSLVLAAVLFAGCESAPENSAESDLLTRQDLAADWKRGVSSKGRWFARFASADQIAFGCNMSEAKARRYHQELKGTFSASLLSELEADCEARSTKSPRVGNDSDRADVEPAASPRDTLRQVIGICESSSDPEQCMQSHPDISASSTVRAF